MCKLKKKKGKSLEKIKTIFGEENNPYNKFDGDSKIKFTPHYKLGKEEVFFLENAKDLIENKEILNLKEGETTSFDSIISSEWGSVDFLIYLDNNDLYYQRIIGKKYLTTKVHLKFIEGSPEMKEEAEGIIIASKPDAVYNIHENRLYFKDFFKATKIFKGLENLYKEATNDEINTFLGHSFVKRHLDFKNSHITPHKRKRIAVIMREISEEENVKLKEYGLRYCPEFFEEDKIIVNNQDSLDALIHIVGETYFTGEISGEKKMTNSARGISS